MDIVKQSDNYRKIADTFLKNSELIFVLQKYGEVTFEGAYAGNVMLHGDVDIKIVREKEFTMEEMFSILKDIHMSSPNAFRSYYVKGDWADPRKGDKYPFGQYLGLKAFIENENWKFDLWFISADENKRPKEGIEIGKVILTDEQRRTILEFKQFRNEKNSKISGYQIYEAVLTQGLTNPESFFNQNSK